MRQDETYKFLDKIYNWYNKVPSNLSVIFILSAPYWSITWCWSVSLKLCPFMGVSKKLATAYGMGCATTFVDDGYRRQLHHRSLLTVPFGLEYLRTISFIVTIAALVQLTELVIQKTSPVLHQVRIYLPLITTNCAVLGVPLINVSQDNGFSVR